MTDMLFRELSHSVIGAAVEVHKVLGPGFPEKVYQNALEHELNLRQIPFESQKQMLVMYKGLTTAEYFLDILVNKQIILELKALSAIEPVHLSQVIAYLKASNCRLGLIMNFGQQRLQTKRVVF